MNSWNILNFAYLNNGKKSSLRDKMICILFSFACSKERLDGDIKTTEKKVRYIKQKYKMNF